MQLFLVVDEMMNLFHVRLAYRSSKEIELPGKCFGPFHVFVCPESGFSFDQIDQCGYVLFRQDGQENMHMFMVSIDVQELYVLGDCEVADMFAQFVFVAFCHQRFSVYCGPYGVDQ